MREDLVSCTTLREQHAHMAERLQALHTLLNEKGRKITDLENENTRLTEENSRLVARINRGAHS